MNGIDNIHAVLNSILSANADIIAATNDRIYSVRIPLHDEIPAITLHRQNKPRDKTESVSYPQFLVSCWGATYTEAYLLAVCVEKCLRDFTGTVLNAEIHSIKYQDVYEEYFIDSNMYCISPLFTIIFVDI